jgi:hypothetical protein
MRRSRAIRFGALWAVAGLAGGTGCTHNHYYYNTPGTVSAPGMIGACDPMPPGTVISSTAPSVGAVCDVPPAGQPGAMVAQNAPRTSPIVSNAARPVNPQPIYSQPSGLLGRRNGNGLVWRGSQTESLATTRIEGAVDDETAVK